MKFRDITPMLETMDMKATIAFYVDVLGFTLDNLLETDNLINWCSLSKDTVFIMFSSPNKTMRYEKIVLSGSLYIYVDDVDSYWDNIKEKVKIVYPIENFDYGMREFAIKDNNGYVLNFGSEV